MDTALIPREVLAGWERPFGTVAPAPRETGTPVGRWVWLAALLLLGIEWWWRGRPEPADDVAVVNRHVA
jgi:hypothetical protein